MSFFNLARLVEVFCFENLSLLVEPFVCKHLRWFWRQQSIWCYVAPKTSVQQQRYSVGVCWAEARVKIARMTLTIKLDGNWSSFQLANSAPPLSVTDSAIAPSARMCHIGISMSPRLSWSHHCGWPTMMMALGISSSATSPCSSTLTPTQSHRDVYQHWWTYGIYIS